MTDSAVREPEALASDEDRRSQILDCTCRVIARDGADGLRMAAVAREADVSSALLHYYFATREDLIRLAFEHHDRRETARSAQRLADIADPVERIRDVLAQELSEDEGVREGWVLWSEMERSAIFREDSRASVAARAGRWVGLLAALITEAKDADRVPAEVDSPSAALRLTALIDGLGIHVLIGRLPREQALAELEVAMREILHLDATGG
ncbi:MAG: TetR/AcrR family transcriptional regulator [Gaiellales bacterium]